MPTDAAFASGALGFFGEKYGPEVSVYTITATDGHIISKEICTGPHVANSEGFGHFHITEEASVGVGLRRIKATLS